MDTNANLGRFLAIASALGALMSGAWYGISIYNQSQLQAAQEKARIAAEEQVRQEQELSRLQRCDDIAQEQILLNEEFRRVQAEHPISSAQLSRCLAEPEFEQENCFNTYCTMSFIFDGNKCAIYGRKITTLAEKQVDLARRADRDNCENVPDSEMARAFAS